MQALGGRRGICRRTFDGLEKVASSFQSGIGSMVTLWSEAHCGAV